MNKKEFSNKFEEGMLEITAILNNDCDFQAITNSDNEEFIFEYDTTSINLTIFQCYECQCGSCDLHNKEIRRDQMCLKLHINVDDKRNSYDAFNLIEISTNGKVDSNLLIQKVKETLSQLKDFSFLNKG